MKMFEAVAWMIRIGDAPHWSYCETESDADFYGKQSGMRYEKKPLFTEAQLREAVQYAANAKTEWPADEAISYLHGCSKGYDLFEAELKQLQEQNTALDAKLASNEAVMRQALEAMRLGQHRDIAKAIKALEDALK